MRTGTDALDYLPLALSLVPDSPRSAGTFGPPTYPPHAVAAFVTWRDGGTGAFPPHYRRVDTNAHPPNQADTFPWRLAAAFPTGHPHPPPPTTPHERAGSVPFPLTARFGLSHFPGRAGADLPGVEPTWMILTLVS